MILIADQIKLNQDVLALLLIEKIKTLNLGDTYVYYNFPFYRGETKEDLVQAHVLFVSKTYGVIFFRCVESQESFNSIEKIKLDNLDSHIYSKINKREELRKDRRDLKINVTPCVFVNSKEKFEDFVFVNQDMIQEIIQNNKKDELNNEEFEILIAVIEGSINLKNKKDRNFDNSETLTKGKILNLIQSREAVFDIEQKRAALNILDSPQRIRGLAGSGKTIILTMKVALFHLQNPDANILYTYFTKALFGQVKYLIEKYYRDFSENREPDWNKIHILHGWGGKGLRGVYSDTCFENDIKVIDFFEARNKDPKDPFSYIFEQLDKHQLKQKYDLTLIDEGQDFPKYFYRVCRKITKNNRIVWAYDDFQNIFDTEIQNEKNTFGKDSSGHYYVDFSKDENNLQDIVLYKCYRNPRVALISAFSLGLGIYNDKIFQRLENNKLWEDLGFIVEKGESKDYDEMVISRPEKNSPSESNKYFTAESISAYLFENISQECEFVVNSIFEDIKKQNLRPDDISVISLDSKNIGAYFSNIETGLKGLGINVFNILSASRNNTKYSIDNHVTLSTISKAKGNESGMVYITGIDTVFNDANKDFIIQRNKVFTAITRSKGWVTISGFKTAQQCVLELQMLKKMDYKLVFKQPSERDTKTIRRDMTQAQSFLNEFNKNLDELMRNTGMKYDDVLKLINNQSKDRDKKE